jgi:hypothetical protein
MPLSFADIGSLGSFAEIEDIMPSAFSTPVGTSAAGIELPVKERKCVGRHSISKALRMACAANLGELD